MLRTGGQVDAGGIDEVPALAGGNRHGGIGPIRVGIIGRADDVGLRILGEHSAFARRKVYLCQSRGIAPSRVHNEGRSSIGADTVKPGRVSVLCRNLQELAPGSIRLPSLHLDRAIRQKTAAEMHGKVTRRIDTLEAGVLEKRLAFGAPTLIRTMSNSL